MRLVNYTIHAHDKYFIYTPVDYFSRKNSIDCHFGNHIYISLCPDFTRMNNYVFIRRESLYRKFRINFSETNLRQTINKVLDYSQKTL